MMDGLTLALIKALSGAGSPGKSAYEIAVENGFEGTEQEWLESLVGQSAGFGTPTASATSLTSGEQPTASVSASGEDTAKVFDFQFGIPAGADGKTPQKGVDYYTDADKEELLDELKKQSNVISLSYSGGKTISITPEQHKLIFSDSPPNITIFRNDTTSYLILSPIIKTSSEVYYTSNVAMGNFLVAYLMMFTINDETYGSYAELEFGLVPKITASDANKILVVSSDFSYELKPITDLISNGDEVSY